MERSLLVVIDTGGLEAQQTAEYRAERPGLAPLARDSSRYVTEITNQARIAVDEADVIVLGVDGKDGLTAADEDLAEFLQQTTKPILLAVNKADSEQRRQNGGGILGARCWRTNRDQRIPWNRGW